MKAPWRALCYLWYHYQSRFYIKDGTFSLTTKEMKQRFCTEYNVKTIYDISQNQVDEWFKSNKSHAKYIYFAGDYLENDWGKDVKV